MTQNSLSTALDPSPETNPSTQELNNSLFKLKWQMLTEGKLGILMPAKVLTIQKEEERIKKFINDFGTKAQIDHTATQIALIWAHFKARSDKATTATQKEKLLIKFAQKEIKLLRKISNAIGDEKTLRETENKDTSSQTQNPASNNENKEELSTPHEKPALEEEEINEKKRQEELREIEYQKLREKYLKARNDDSYLTNLRQSKKPVQIQEES